METMKLFGGAIAYMIGKVKAPRMCNCGNPVLEGENGCVSCMAQLVRSGFLSQDRIKEIQEKAKKINVIIPATREEFFANLAKY